MNKKSSLDKCSKDTSHNEDIRSIAHYQQIAKLFEYPKANFVDDVSKLNSLCNKRYPLANQQLKKFLALLPSNNLTAMQELFTRTFDVQAFTTLDIGYVLFGDDYKRGELLANLNREHNKANNDCGVELADHLPNLLRLLPKLADSELAEELVQEIIAPALSIMLSEFSKQSIEKKNKSYQKHYKTLIELPKGKPGVATLYQFALRSLREVLQQDFILIEKSWPKTTNDFLQSIVRENTIEENSNPCS